MESKNSNLKTLEKLAYQLETGLNFDGTSKLNLEQKDELLHIIQGGVKDILLKNYWFTLGIKVPVFVQYTPQEIKEAHEKLGFSQDCDEPYFGKLNNQLDAVMDISNIDDRKAEDYLIKSFQPNAEVLDTWEDPSFWISSKDEDSTTIKWRVNFPSLKDPLASILEYQDYSISSADFRPQLPNTDYGQTIRDSIKNIMHRAVLRKDFKCAEQSALLLGDYSKKGIYSEQLKDSLRVTGD